MYENYVYDYFLDYFGTDMQKKKDIKNATFT